MKIFLIRAKTSMFEQVSYFPVTVSEGRESHSSNTRIPTPATVTAFVFMTVIQSETYAPICLSGHLPIDTPLYPTEEKPCLWRSIWSTFWKYGSPSRPPVSMTENIRRGYCSSALMGLMSKIMQNYSARFLCWHRVLQLMCLLVRTVIKEIKHGLRAAWGKKKWS